MIEPFPKPDGGTTPSGGAPADLSGTSLHGRVTGIPDVESGAAEWAGCVGFSRAMTLGLLEDIPEDKLSYQPTPRGNHAIHVTGHLTVTDDGLW